MSKLFFDLRSTHNPNRWFLPITDDLCVGPAGKTFMFGGVGLASAIQALEQTCGRPVVWATAQYLSYARPGSVVDLDVHVPVTGKHISQARVTGHVGDVEIFSVNSALGSRPGDLSHQWAKAPEVPPPHDCEPSGRWPGQEKGVHGRLIVRVAHGNVHGRDAEPGGQVSQDGRLVLWVRAIGGEAMNASLLAVIADFVPSGIGSALGVHAGGNSLDNTLRVRRVVPTEWVLCEIQITGVHAGFAHGSMYLFSENGELMATASQSLIVRIREPAANPGG